MARIPFTIEALEAMITAGYVRVAKHPEADLYIYNYTAKAQYESMWNEVTMSCRGLILDAHYGIVARPFVKFFNYGEISDHLIPAESFEVYDKMDGSLGILYWWNDIPYIATRGSFVSDQAIRAGQMLHVKYAASLPQLDRSKTYLFEIIYPENRIVIDYGMNEDLVLLAVVDTASGKEYVLENIGFPLVTRYDGLSDLEAIRSIQMADKEGFIIRFKSGYRLKIKFNEYVRLHRIITQVSSKTIWQHLMNGDPMDEMLERVPDEFYDWVRSIIADLQSAYDKIEAEARSEFKILKDRKTTALYFMTCQCPPVLFRMLENKKYDTIIWKMVRPEYERPFRNNLEE
jgi:RNA ligase